MPARINSEQVELILSKRNKVQESGNHDQPLHLI